MAINLDPVDGNFILTSRDGNGNENAITLSESDILTLALSAQSLQLEILRRRDPQGESHSAVAVAELAHIELHDESLNEAILMTLAAKNGSRSRLAPTVHGAERLPFRRMPSQYVNLMPGSRLPTRPAIGTIIPAPTRSGCKLLS